MTDDDEIWDRKSGKYFDRDGNELTLREWVSKYDGGTIEAIDVCHDYVDDVRVSTVWLGIDHGYGPGPPLIFETLVFGGPLDQDQRRYSTEDEARHGHAEVLAEVRMAAVSGQARDPNKNVVQQFVEHLREEHEADG